MPSPYVEMPLFALTLNPLKSLSRIKFTTPDTASEPYTADAPPVTTSTLFTRSWGKVSTLTVPLALDATTRWPSSSTSVRWDPKLRKLSTFAAVSVLALLTLRVFCEPMNSGSLFRPSAILLGVVACNWDTSKTVSGVGEFTASEITREPVTTTDSTPVFWARAAQVSAKVLTVQSRVTPMLDLKFIFPSWFFYYLSAIKCDFLLVRDGDVVGRWYETGGSCGY